ncbi:MAG TPA: ABC transporter permease [Nitrososphaerales archaeon]|nr:ABC transporter permease [Nitrososphaerales archaeon]
MNLFRFLLRRLAFAVFVLFCVLTLTFVLSHLIPGDVIQAWLGKEAEQFPNVAKLYAAKYHLNDPIYVQYFYYVTGMLQGNLGISPSRGFVPVTSVIEQTLPLTLQIVFLAFVLCVVLGLLLGILAARYHDTPIDTLIRIFYLGSYSSPPYFIGIVILVIASLYLRILPTGGAYNPLAVSPSPSITGFPILDALIQGNFAFAENASIHLILPALTLAIVTFGVITRVARSSLLDVMKTDYIRTARSKGLDEGSVFYRHGLPNAAISLITISSLVMTFLLTGAVFVEYLFSYPGMGHYAYTALQGSDYPGIMATVFVFAAIIITTNLVADILYAWADPEIRLG